MVEITFDCPLAIEVLTLHDSKLVQKIWFSYGIGWWSDRFALVASVLDYPAQLGISVYGGKPCIIYIDPSYEDNSNIKTLVSMTLTLHDILTEDQYLFHSLGGDINVDTIDLTKITVIVDSWMKSQC